MPKLVELEFNGTLSEGYQVKLKVGPEGERATVEQSGSLPKAPELSLKLTQWREEYARISSPSRVIQDVNIYLEQISPFDRCRELAEDLKTVFHAWLASELFRNLDARLREALNPSDVIRILIRAKDKELHRLPWQTWEILESYPYAEIAMGAPEFNIQENSIRTELGNPESVDKDVRILAILGDTSGINVEKDREELDALQRAKVEFLVTPSRESVIEKLWSETWDIVYFAGHSRTEGEKGKIYINAQEYLSVEDVRNGLKRSIASGLQLAIFNSCDGLGIAWDLEKLQIPQIIVMREPVPDEVAQKFVKYFLKAYSGGESLCLSVIYARQRLEGEEHKFPCATWLPIIYQNPVGIPLDWPKPISQLEVAIQSEPSASKAIPQLQGNSQDINPKWRRLKLGLSVSLACTSLVMGIRFLGFLEKWELLTYDHLMRLRPAEKIVPRILIVEMTEEDTSQYGYPVDDQTLANVVKEIQEFQPSVIGIDLHRYQARGNGRDNLIDLFEKNQNLFTVCQYNSKDKNLASPPIEFSEQQKISQVGFNDFPSDREYGSRTVRRHLLDYNPQRADSINLCSTPYSFSFLLSYHYLEKKGTQPMTINSDDNWQFGSTVFDSLGNRFGAYQDLGNSSQVMINYRSDLPGQKVSFRQVLEGQLKPDYVRDRIVIIGVTSPTSGDVFDTPIGRISGVWIEAHMVSQILSSVLDERPLIWALPQYFDFQWGDALFILGWSIIGSGLVLTKNHYMQNHFINLAILLVLYITSLLSIIHGCFLPLLPTAFSLLLSNYLTSFINDRFPLEAKSE